MIPLKTHSQNKRVLLFLYPFTDFRHWEWISFQYLHQKRKSLCLPFGHCRNLFVLSECAGFCDIDDGLIFTSEGALDENQCLHLPSSVPAATSVLNITLKETCIEHVVNDKVGLVLSCFTERYLTWHRGLFNSNWNQNEIYLIRYKGLGCSLKIV